MALCVQIAMLASTRMLAVRPVIHVLPTYISLKTDRVGLPRRVRYVILASTPSTSNFSAPGSRRQGAYQWGLTGAEAECLFFFVQFSLSGLVSGEISCCRLHAGGSARASPCDPTDDIVRVWSRFASWYMAIKTCRLSDHEVICRR